MPERVRKSPSLARIVSSRIVVFALVAMMVQVAVVLVDYYFDDAKLASLMIEGETDALVKGVSVGSDGPTYAVPRGMRRYKGSRGGYFTRVRTPEGGVVYSNCDASCV